MPYPSLWNLLSDPELPTSVICMPRPAVVPVSYVPLSLPGTFYWFSPSQTIIPMCLCTSNSLTVSLCLRSGWGKVVSGTQPQRYGFGRSRWGPKMPEFFHKLPGD